MASGTATKEKSGVKLKKPKKFKVIMHNDDFTPMDFVVDILIQVFHKEYEEAIALMMNVHKGQRAVVGIYSYDIAYSRTDLAMSRAREEGYPFRVTCEEA